FDSLFVTTNRWRIARTGRTYPARGVNRGRLRHGRSSESTLADWYVDRAAGLVQSGPPRAPQRGPRKPRTAAPRPVVGVDPGGLVRGPRCGARGGPDCLGTPERHRSVVAPCDGALPPERDV